MVRVHSFSEAGGHHLNEDAFRVQAHPLAADCWLCLVAGGQGGQAAGHSGGAARVSSRAGLPAGAVDRSGCLVRHRATNRLGIGAAWKWYNGLGLPMTFRGEYRW
jgi:hypothetical protein